MLTILQRIDALFDKAANDGDPVAELRLVEQDIKSWDAAVTEFCVIQDPAYTGRGRAYKGVPINEDAVSHGRTVGAFAPGSRARRIALPPENWEGGWVIG